MVEKQIENSAEEAKSSGKEKVLSVNSNEFKPGQAISVSSVDSKRSNEEMADNLATLIDSLLVNTNSDLVNSMTIE